VRQIGGIEAEIRMILEADGVCYGRD